MADKEIGKPEESEREREQSRQTETQTFPRGQQQTEADRQRGKDAADTRSEIPSVIFVEQWKWRSPRTLLDALLILFTGGVMWAHFQYAATARQAQRPWVGPAEIGTHNGESVINSVTVSANNPIDIAISFKNFGPSPALNVASDFEVTLGSVPPVESINWTENTAQPMSENCHGTVDSEHGLPLFPNPGPGLMIEDIEESRRPSISTIDADAIKATKKTLWFVGCFVYRDQWDKIHHTDVCAYFTHPDGSMQGTFSFCAKGNEAD
jgi:hypothetical protein